MIHTDFLLYNISKLLNCDDNPVPYRRGRDMSLVPELNNAWLLVKNGLIEDFGEMSSLPELNIHKIDGQQGFVMPTFVDAHTHLVFAETRENEMAARIRGMSYQEIAANGGGILNSAKRLQQMDEELLYSRSWQRLMQAVETGTGAFEMKSGYGLSTESELKILRIIRRLSEESGLPIRSTFLGAHAYPLQYREDHQGYLRQIIDEMLPAIAKANLADYCDVFCEKGFFNPEETEDIIIAARAHQLKVRLHTNQFTHSGGIELAIRHQAISVDHLEELSEEEIAMLASSTVIPITLPTAAFFMNCPYPPARKMIEAGLGLVAATDFNPGTSPSSDMNMCFSLACIKMRMTPEEALNAVTINAAFALELNKYVGSIERGKFAHLILSRPGMNLNSIPYSLGRQWISKVILGAIHDLPNG
ncbi:MAG: imidazolonepropionase [Saprospiraceae bacterium]|nr:imidazolonepropionase [Saprospiraceae bacterium]HMW39528.1 imidazolonepropionase [Saprospiraceae bacterium]HMX89466.1 imidazolonepropionase [Saprospiraceae bacterium]HMZ41298.1 imidazolonepropionase [Saprospiraceae bacterium]HNA65468.1 imidazolonepropionase [Saprospiraceae bacterium]